jgi:MraZ protein
MKTPSSFKGKTVHTINSSGRISIPSKIRDVLKMKYQDETIVLINYGKHLIAYPLVEWAKKEQELAENPPPTPEARKALHLLYSSMEECSIDKQGRILISPELRKSVGLEKECVIVGIMNKFEIWSKENWDKEFDNEEKQLLLCYYGKALQPCFVLRTCYQACIL